MKQQGVVIVGAGVVGLCSAYYALKRGMDVTVLEREESGGDNCSMGNAGMVVPSHFIPLAAPGMISKGLRWMLNSESPFHIRPRLDINLMRWVWLFWRHANEHHVLAVQELLRDLNMESRRLFGELNEEEDFGLVKRGLLMLCKTQQGLDEEARMAKVAASLGLGVDVIDSKELADLDSGVAMNVVGGVHYRDDCHLNPVRFMKSMRQRVLAMGGKIQSGVRVERLVASEWKVVSLVSDQGEISGDEFVVAGGSWSADLLRTIGLRLPLQAGKGYSLTLGKPPEIPQLCSILSEAKVAVTPMDGRLRFGGTMEVGGNDLSVNPDRVRGIVKSVASYFPNFRMEDFDGVPPWAGLRPVTPDGIPYIGRVKTHSNLIVAAGHAMMGLSTGPVTGQVVSDLLTGDDPFRSIESMSVSRF